MVLNIPNLLSQKEALVNVVSDNGTMMIHTSWELPQEDNSTPNVIIAFEYYADNYPTGDLITFKSKEEYYSTIKNVGWIIENLPLEHEFFKGYVYEDLGDNPSQVLLDTIREEAEDTFFGDEILYVSKPQLL